VYQKTILPSGIKVISEEIPHSHSVSVGFWVRTGSRDESAEENGSAHFLEHLAFKGTQRRGPGDLAREIDQLGGSANAFTSKENTCFHGRVLADQLPRLIDLLSDILLNPVYQPEELERERQVILQEILTQEDSPEDYIHELFSLRHVCLGTPAPWAADPDHYVAIVLNLILGGNMSSRLFQEVREKRALCYAIYSFFSSYSDTGLLAVNAAVGPENLKTLLEIIRIELNRLAEQEISDQELQAAQEYLRRSLYLSAEDNDNRMIRLARNEINFGCYIPYEEIIAHLQAVTAPQINRLAQKLFDPSNWTRVFLGPMTENDIPQELQ